MFHKISYGHIIFLITLIVKGNTRLIIMASLYAKNLAYLFQLLHFYIFNYYVIIIFSNKIYFKT